MEQYQKLSSDKIGRPRVDLQSPLVSSPPILPPVIARSMTPSIDNSQWRELPPGQEEAAFRIRGISSLIGMRSIPTRVARWSDLGLSGLYALLPILRNTLTGILERGSRRA